VSLNELIRVAPHAWHGIELYRPDWSDHSHSLAFSTELPSENLSFFLILNAYWAPLHFELPTARNKQTIQWRRWIDTFLDSPNDIVPWEEAQTVSGSKYCAGPHSVVVLLARLGEKR
jgi:glycogen operon protein